MTTCEFTIEVPRDDVMAGDWRDDPRWDQIIEFVDGLFPGSDLSFSGVLRLEEP